jgi:hypothetical protein
VIVLIYEGAPEDPFNQTVRAVDADSLEDARMRFPHAVMVQMYVEPSREDPPPIELMKTRAVPVWRF